METDIQTVFDAWNDDNKFSGVVSVTREKECLFEASAGHRNMGERLKNSVKTKFGIASGTKIFTAIAICKLIQQGKLTLEANLLDLLDYKFPHFSPAITVKQLLTHTAGVPDYFDEEVTSDIEAIWGDLPVYKLTELSHFLPLFQNLEMKYEPGMRYAYSNSGFILLGLIIEAVSGKRYQDFVTEKVIKPCGLINTGFYRMDMLPANTALGYIFDQELQGWRTNFFSLPIIGGAEGGLFTNARDMHVFWTKLVGNKLLNREMTNQVLSPRIELQSRTSTNTFYGLGVFIAKTNDVISRYYVMGADPGAGFFSVYYPQNKIVATALVNNGKNIFPLLRELNNVIV